MEMVLGVVDLKLGLRLNALVLRLELGDVGSALLVWAEGWDLCS